jgi:peptidyl-prolyl cis-trans isomerase SurA
MHLKYINKVSILIVLGITVTLAAQAQYDGKQLIDKIVAKVDNHIILYSDIEFAYLDLASRGGLVGENPKCKVLESLITQKMLLAIAEIDSVEILDVEVDMQLERRMQYFISQSGGSADALEEYYGKSIDQIQEEMRVDMKEQMVAQKMRANISENVTITPSHIRRFFSKIPKDSLPYFSEEVEVAQIVKIAEVGRKQKDAVLLRLDEIRNDILRGADFGIMAETYSMDPGSARNGGELPGWYKRGELAPEYEAACFSLAPGELSEPVETQFGFHLIQLIERRGNEFRSKHILITPNSSDYDIQKTINQLDSVRTHIINSGEDFEKIAKDYSDDKLSAPSGGFFLDNSGSTRIPVDQLDPTIYFTLDTMAIGSISHPTSYRMQDGKEAVRILYYKSKIPPHQANLEDDWQKIQEAALREKKSKAEAQWVKDSKGLVYIYIDDDFKHCNIVSR